MTVPPVSARILLAEDDEFVRTLAERVLHQAGYDVVVAVNGEEALRCAELGPFDLYVLDVVMPRVRGDLVASWIRERYPDARVLFFTGYVDRLARAETASSDGAYLAKPVTMRGLLDAVASLLSSSLETG